MSKFTLLVFFSAIIGAAGGWAVHHSRFGNGDVFFGEMGYSDRSITAANLKEHMTSMNPSAVPVVELPNGSNFDFGVMPPESKGEHLFVIKNAGEGDLRLRLGATTCKCTLGSLEDELLKPGEQTSVKLEWTVTTNDKTFGQSAQILTNDPQQVAVDLGVHGRVIRDIEMVPEDLGFGNVSSSEPITLTAKIYSYMDSPITNPKVTFTSDDLNDLSEVTITPFEPSDADGTNARATEAFEIAVRIEPGLKQGPLSQNMIFGFDASSPPDGEQVESADQGKTQMQFAAAIAGRVIGSISMITTPNLTSTEGGNYIYDFGEVGPDGPFIGKAFVVLKGSGRDNERLKVESVSPEEVIKAKFGEPKNRGGTVLFPLEFELIPQAEPMKLLGRVKGDYGKIEITSDAPNGDRLTLGLKFSLEAR